MFSILSVLYLICICLHSRLNIAMRHEVFVGFCLIGVHCNPSIQEDQMFKAKPKAYQTNQNTTLLVLSKDFLFTYTKDDFKGRKKYNKERPITKCHSCPLSQNHGET